MTRVRVQEAASVRIDEIYRYTRDRWGAAQADAYITGLFEAFERIEAGGIRSRPTSSSRIRGERVRIPIRETLRLLVKTLENGDIGIVTVLHERMHQIDRFREDLGE